VCLYQGHNLLHSIWKRFANHSQKYTGSRQKSLSRVTKLLTLWFHGKDASDPPHSAEVWKRVTVFYERSGANFNLVQSLYETNTPRTSGIAAFNFCYPLQTKSLPRACSTSALLKGFKDSRIRVGRGRARFALGVGDPYFSAKRQPIYVRTQFRFWAMFEKSCSPGIAESEVLLLGDSWATKRISFFNKKLNSLVVNDFKWFGSSDSQNPRGEPLGNRKKCSDEKCVLKF